MKYSSWGIIILKLKKQKKTMEKIMEKIRINLPLTIQMEIYLKEIMIIDLKDTMKIETLNPYVIKILISLKKEDSISSISKRINLSYGWANKWVNELIKEGILKEKKLPDNSIILEPDYLFIDRLSSELFSDKSALDEEITIEVLNGTSKAGLAYNAARLIKNMGADVIGIADADVDVDVEDTIIYYRNQKIKKSYTLAKIDQIFHPKNIKLNEKIEADLTLILGKNFTRFH